MSELQAIPSKFLYNRISRGADYKISPFVTIQRPVLDKSSYNADGIY